MSSDSTNIIVLIQGIYLHQWKNFLSLRILFCGHFATLVNIKNTIVCFMILTGLRKYAHSSHSYIAADVHSTGCCSTAKAVTPCQFFQAEALDSMSCDSQSDDNCIHADTLDDSVYVS